MRYKISYYDNQGRCLYTSKISNSLKEIRLEYPPSDSSFIKIFKYINKFEEKFNAQVEKIRL